MIMQCISSRYDQPGYKTYSKLEAVLLKGVTGKSYAEELSFITELYANDIDMCLLQTQLSLVQTHFKDGSSTPTLMDVVDYVKSLQAHRLEGFAGKCCYGLTLCSRHLLVLKTLTEVVS